MKLKKQLTTQQVVEMGANCSGSRWVVTDKHVDYATGYCRSVSSRVAAVELTGMADICSCNNRTSHIRVGRIYRVTPIIAGRIINNLISI